MEQPVQPHTVRQSVALHLIPGALLTIAYFLCAPSVMRAGYPALMALLLCILVILVPVELGILFCEGRKLHGSYSLEGVVLNREHLPVWQYLVFVPVLLLWAAAAFILLTPLDNFLIRTLFSWMPAWTAPAALTANIAQYSRSALITTTAFAFALNGIAGPVVEELYFRGYLLPRIPASRRWSPLINAVLFSLYHFFSPWQFITRIVALVVPLYVVSWKRNLYLNMLMHCLLNTLGMVSLVGLAAR
jgi:membrane protease YdiL (CAAX protease family)